MYSLGDRHVFLSSCHSHCVKNMKLSLGLDLVSVLPLSGPEKLICLLWTKMNNTSRLREIVWEPRKMDPVDI